MNVYPVVKLTQQFIADSRKRKSGKIITILSSGIINKPPLGWSEYIANKAYLHSMAKSWAVENVSFGITSNCVSPSFMQTNLTKQTDKRIVELMISDNPHKRLLTEVEVAEAVSFLVTASPHINGSNLIINAAQDII
jgi:3-oxoacyl-[acyl-carrier protein] reductase